MKYSLIIWDWNGTLIDDAEASLNAVNDMLTRRGKQKITMEQYYEYIDTPIIRFYEHVLDKDELDMSVIVPEFNERYEANLKSNALMPHAVETLEFFKKHGIKQVILSSTATVILKEMTAKYGVAEYFDALIGADDFMVTGKTEKGKRYLRSNGISPSDCVLVGDTLHDAETASAAGCDCVLIPNGHQSYKDLKASGKTVINDISELEKLLFVS